MLGKLDERAENLSVAGGRLYNPGWNLATDIPAMLTVSTLVTRAALERRESRGGHTRDDYPKTDPEFAKVNLVQRLAPDGELRHGGRRAARDARRAEGTARGGAELMSDQRPSDVPSVEAVRPKKSQRVAPPRHRPGTATDDGVTMTVWRGDPDGGEFIDYVMPISRR